MVEVPAGWDFGVRWHLKDGLANCFLILLKGIYSKLCGGLNLRNLFIKTEKIKHTTFRRVLWSLASLKITSIGYFTLIGKFLQTQFYYPNLFSFLNGFFGLGEHIILSFENVSQIVDMLTAETILQICWVVESKRKKEKSHLKSSFLGWNESYCSSS